MKKISSREERCLFFFRVNGYWFWIPVLGQFIGGILGGILYFITVQWHHPRVREGEQKLLLPDKMNGDGDKLET